MKKQRPPDGTYIQLISEHELHIIYGHFTDEQANAILLREYGCTFDPGLLVRCWAHWSFSRQPDEYDKEIMFHRHPGRGRFPVTGIGVLFDDEG